MIWFEIKWFFKMNWPVLLFAAAILACGIPAAHFVKDAAYIVKYYEPPPERITIEAQGVVANIRSTGAWCMYDTEVQFTDGSIFLLQYSVVQKYKLKRGQKIKIIRSSYRGRTIEKIK